MWRQVVISDSDDNAEGVIVIFKPGHNFRINIISKRANYRDSDRFYPPIPVRALFRKMRLAFHTNAKKSFEISCRILWSPLKVG
jgi:hypothetical protein